MNISKNMLAGLAIAGLAFAQPVSAQASATRSLHSVPVVGISATAPSGVRSGEILGQSEGFAGRRNDGGRLFWLVGLGVSLGLFIWLVADDDGTDLPPASPG